GLPRHYGCVIAVGSAGVLVNIGLAAAVVAARRRHQIKFPNMHQPDAPDFNWAVQVHLDYSSEAAFFYFTLLTGGLDSPRLAALAGLAFLLSRSVARQQAAARARTAQAVGKREQVFSQNFSAELGTGEWSQFSWITFGIMLYTSCASAVSLLRQ
ncbi:hypothetical protein BOX15_Mlig010869g2, partial [Macrostomum lignano]